MRSARRSRRDVCCVGVMSATLGRRIAPPQRPQGGSSAYPRRRTQTAPERYETPATLVVMRRERAIDIGIALGVFVLTVLLLAGGGVSSDEEARSLDLLGVALAARRPYPCSRGGGRRWLSSRRRRPRAVALSALDYPPGPPIGSTVALYFVGLSGSRERTGGRLTAAVVVLFFFVAHVAAAGYGRDQLPVVPALFGALVWGGAWVARRPRPTAARTRRRRSRSAPARPSARPSANGDSPPPRSERASRGTSTTPRDMRST